LVEIGEFERVDVRCAYWSLGSSENPVVIRTQAEYESQIEQCYSDPLQRYIDDNYQRALQNVKRDNPGLTDEEFEELVWEWLNRYAPFPGDIQEYTQPPIDFEESTLLGFDYDTNGCERPDHYIQFLEPDSEGDPLLRVIVVRHGMCDMLIYRSDWILVRKIQEDEDVGFEMVHYTTDDW